MKVSSGDYDDHAKGRKCEIFYRNIFTETKISTFENTIVMLVFTGTAVLVLYVILINYVSVPVHSQSVENEVDQVTTQTIGAVERGSTAENVARNLASFEDSSFNTLVQSNNQLINNIADHSTAANRLLEGSGAIFFGSDSNIVDQNNEQSIKDVTKESSGENRAGILSELRFGSDDNTIDQSNTQTIEGVSDASFAGNLAIIVTQSFGTTDNGATQKNEQRIEDLSYGSEAVNLAADLAQFDAEGGPANDNEVVQRNDQNIESIKKGSVANSAINDAHFSGGREYNVLQSNIQDINDITDTSHNNANNGAFVGASFDGLTDVSDTNSIDQSNVQSIKESKKESDSDNSGLNAAVLRGSDNNNVEQTNSQTIGDVKSLEQIIRQTTMLN